MTLQGLLLAAGAGSRMGMPKALVRGDDGEPWLLRGVRVLADGGCDGVTVVLGASAAEARDLLAGVDVRVVVAEDWADGMAASLRAGLVALAGPTGDAAIDAAVVSLVDLPDVDAAVVHRLLASVTDGDDGSPDRGVLARAAYAGEPGHPVLLGRDHWAGIVSAAAGDRGARDYLATHPVRLVECGDLATGRDVDHRRHRDA